MATYTLTASQLQGAGISNVFDIPDASAQAYLTATGISDTLQQNIVAELVRDLKNYGIWSKMKAIYPFVTDNRNRVSYSEDFSNAFWNKNGATVTANDTTAPDGTLTADKVVFTNSSSYITSFGISSVTGTTTQSIYIKGTAGQTISLDDVFTFAPLVTLTGDWQRVTFTTTNAANHGISVSKAQGATASTIWIWGAQVELGSTATTYQPIATTQQAFISNQFKYNLVNPVDSDAAFRLVFNGGWTFSSNGALPNGTNAYADTKLNPIVQNIKESYGVYTRTSDGSGVRILIGCREGTKENYISPSITTLNIRGTLGSSTGLLSNSKGFIIGYDLDDTSNQYTNINGVKFSGTRTFNGSPNFNFFISAWNNDGSPSFYSSAEMSFAFISDRLTDNQASNLYTAVQAFQTKLSRQV